MPTLTVRRKRRRLPLTSLPVCLRQWLLVAVGAVLLSACAPDGARSDASSVPSSAIAPGAGVAGGPNADTEPARDPDAARALEHVRALAGEIGVREAGTPGERRGAEYVRARLEEYGYRAVIEPFTVEVPRDQTSIAGAGEPIGAVAMTGAPDGEARGRLVFIGLGRPDDLAQRDLRGTIALANRGGQVPFRDKAVAAQRAGALALIVANNQPGRFRGSIASGTPDVSIPVVGVTSDEAERLDAIVAQGGVITVRALRTGDAFESYNVAGRPSTGTCTAYVGAHLDSVAGAPGANDNASGTAGMLELARTQRLPGVCYLAFGAEELGLFGSEAFVRAHGVDDVRFMLNLDMLGKLAGPEVVAVATDNASRAFAERASRAAAAAGVTLQPGTFPPFASSDHASFTEAGVPAVIFHDAEATEIYTPGDDVQDIEPESLEVMLRAAAAVLRDAAR